MLSAKPRPGEAGAPAPCYVAIYLGDACDSPGGVYRVMPQAQSKLFGAKPALCGTIIPNWLQESADNLEHTSSIAAQADITDGSGVGGILATFTAAFDCSERPWTPRDVAAATVGGDADTCFIGIVPGVACSPGTKGAVYLLSSMWCVLRQRGVLSRSPHAQQRRETVGCLHRTLATARFGQASTAPHP